MLPESNITQYVTDKIEIQTQPSFTHKMLIEKERVQGKTDGMDAFRQMIYKCINTEFGVYPIYPNFGVKKRDLFGKPKTYAYIVLTRRIEDALMLDDRVKEVSNFEYVNEWSKDEDLGMKFKVKSIFGDEIEVEEVFSFV